MYISSIIKAAYAAEIVDFKRELRTRHPLTLKQFAQQFEQAELDRNPA